MKFSRQKVLSAFLIILTFLVFFLLFRHIDAAEVMFLLREIPFLSWVSAVILTLSSLAATVWRWHIILRSMGFHIPMHKCLLIILGVWPLGAVSPAKAGDLFRAMSLRAQIKPMIVAGSVFTERIFDFLLLAVLALIGGLSFHKPKISLTAGIMILALIVAFLLTNIKIKFALAEKFRDQLRNFVRSIRSLRSQPRSLIMILILTAFKWLAVFLQTDILFSGVGADVSLGFIIMALPVSIFIGLLPLTLGGMGIRESAMVILFSEVATAPQTLAVGLLYSFFSYWLLAILGIPLMRRALDG